MGGGGTGDVWSGEYEKLKNGCTDFHGDDVGSFPVVDAFSRTHGLFYFE